VFLCVLVFGVPYFSLSLISLTDRKSVGWLGVTETKLLRDTTQTSGGSDLYSGAEGPVSLRHQDLEGGAKPTEFEWTT